MPELNEELNPGCDFSVVMEGFHIDEAGGRYINNASASWELFAMDEDGELAEAATTDGEFEYVEDTEGNYATIVAGSDIENMELGIARAKLIAVFTWDGDEESGLVAGQDTREIIYDVVARGAQ